MNLRDRFAGFIKGLEEGVLPHEKAAKMAEDLDPVLIYFAMRWLREKYPPSDPRASGVVQRVIEFSTTHPKFVTLARKGEHDAMREWFDDTHSLREFSSTDSFADLIVDKFDS